ncbi:hypothetical protein Tco_0077835 [Tanacetum coccineum]
MLLCLPRHTCYEKIPIHFLFLLREFLLVQCSYWYLSAFAMVAAYASRAAIFLEFKTLRDRYGNNGMCDPTKGLVFSGDEIFLRELGKMFPDEDGK